MDEAEALVDEGVVVVFLLAEDLDPEFLGTDGIGEGLEAMRAVSPFGDFLFEDPAVVVVGADALPFPLLFKSLMSGALEKSSW